MKTIASIVLALVTCASCWAQYGFGGGFDTPDGYTIRLESKLEPPQPDLRKAFSFSPGVTGLRRTRQLAGGIRRYSLSKTTHEYFGYDLYVAIVDTHAGKYRLTFGALDLTPEDLDVPDPGSWHILPPPTFPEPQLVSTSDTVAVFI